MAFHYFSENKTFELKNKRKITRWLKQVILHYSKSQGEISFIFCTDDQLLEINQTYLKHFYYTDVITFDYTDQEVISGDIYISTDRVSENARNFGVTFEVELYRVIVHAVLHLLGFKDKGSREKSKMRELENFHLNQIDF